ncbi:hypothetical protein [Pontibacter actiniarum]|uniref:Uncharacterized protein n=1 Tax=Pontibacter actiniarum TaxID=323450 RepID=A0A1X9YV73_9BACT|nr:hypothetical protein [Pontibacter actiniarum]ARS36816.1 hypothetical protein CA264_16070 [Pontibacter actiniarum]
MMITQTYADYCQVWTGVLQTKNEIVEQLQKVVRCDSVTIHAVLLEINPAVIDYNWGDCSSVSVQSNQDFDNIVKTLAELSTITLN